MGSLADFAAPLDHVAAHALRPVIDSDRIGKVLLDVRGQGRPVAFATERVSPSPGAGAGVGESRRGAATNDCRRLLDELVVGEGVDHEQRVVDPAGAVALQDRVADVPDE